LIVSTVVKTAVPVGLDPRVLQRILEEGYGPGAWHAADIKAAIESVAPAEAFWRPSPERHNIAEIAFHHAYYVHSVRGRLANEPVEPFALSGDDWFELGGSGGLSWDDVRRVLSEQYERLTELLERVRAGAARPSVGDNDALELVLGLTCHSAYHAGQIQLIKVLRSHR
jgi:hypothetical protein